MLRSKDTWGESNGKYDENYFRSFTTKNFKNPRPRQIIPSYIQLPTFTIPGNLTEMSINILREDKIRQNSTPMS